MNAAQVRLAAVRGKCQKSQEITALSLSPNATPADLLAAGCINDLELWSMKERKKV
jgi:hypothetical protein